MNLPYTGSISLKSKLIKKKNKQARSPQPREGAEPLLGSDSEEFIVEPQDAESKNTEDKQNHKNDHNLPSPVSAAPNQDDYMIGPISASDRLERIRRFLRKKHNHAERHVYKCRKIVSTKRLRVRGRFVTKPQALQLLGLSVEDLKNNEELQELLTKYETNDPDQNIQFNSVI